MKPFKRWLGLLVIPGVLMLAACGQPATIIGDVDVGYDPTTQEVFVAWQTDRSTTSQVIYGLNGALSEATLEQRGTQHRHVLTQVEPDQTYEFQILMMGQRNEFVVAYGGAIDTPSVESPQWIRVEAGFERAVVSWGKGFGAKMYIIERAEEGSSDFLPISTTDGLEYIDEVATGKTYTYRVRSSDASGALAEPSPAVRITAPANLIQNGSFELVENGMPVGWRTHVWGGQADFVFVEGGGRNGSNGIMIQSESGVDGNWETDVQLAPNTYYRLSAWVKTSNVSANTGLGTVISIHELQDQAGQNGGRTQAIFGNKDWHYVETVFNSSDAALDTPNNFYKVLALMGGWGLSTGTAWYDDFALVPLVVADSRE